MPKCNPKVQRCTLEKKIDNVYLITHFGGVGESCTRVQRRPHNDVYSLDDIVYLTRHRIS